MPFCMENLFTHLEQVVLRMDSRFCTEDGHLLKNNVVEAALALDPQLLHYLLADEKLKRQFFSEVDGLLVFDKVKFQRFVMNKQFLPDSYTSFKNKVGLTNEHGEFLSESREVVLSWPYKDCMLEGGQTKEDAKRDEIFWNETLAPDEINRLTEPKAFTGFLRYDSKGEHEVTEILPDDNLIIKGNNLLALYSLRKRYRNSVKLIYIDPPYNTGNDSFGYNDSFNHSTWLTFMKNRLEVAHELLSNDGNIFINLDWNEVHYCKVLMDTIFGRDCFRNEIVWCYNGPGSPKMRQLNRKHDTILWYTKSTENWVFNGDDVRMESDVHVGGFNGEMGKESSSEYTEKGKIPEDWWEVFYNMSDLESELKKLYKEDYINNNPDWLKAAVAARIRVDGKKRTGYLTEKPYKLIERIIKMGSNEGDLVLDFFAGSGTTGFVANYLQRQFILVEQLDETINLLKSRFIEEPGVIAYKTPVYMELAQANQKLVEEIEAATDTKSLQQIWKQMQEKGFMSYKVKPSVIDEHVKDFEELSLDDQKRFLIECLDKNLLYVPFEEMDDATYQMSEHDKQLTRQFYARR